MYWHRIHNGMLQHVLGGAVIFISLRHCIVPDLKLLLCLQARACEGGNKGSNFKEGVKKI